MNLAIALAVAVPLSVAALFALVRLVRGPAVLDRIVAAEVLLTLMVAAVGAEAAINRHTTTLPVLGVLSLLGFVGSVSIVRFSGSEEP
ncbi:monovalent cation/H+ antiporter complex subunit F [Plantactinospora sp. GCM10030261]|uniref:monovalent cation/H+ antiporter complex subunit F n=1 Tax=Plantactinospora sp. GCM10030261 TaxID=3273420 RepID=UPI00360F3B6C